MTKLTLSNVTFENCSEMDLEKLQKVHTSKIQSYIDWLEVHCRQRHYCFQIKKCSDPNCCLPPENPLLTWLPDPCLDQSGEHYMKYLEVKDLDTTEADRPSLKIPKKQARNEGKRATGGATTATCYHYYDSDRCCYYCHRGR